MHGTIPPEIGDLSNLERFIASGSQNLPNISGAIPPSLGKLTNLVRLDLGGQNVCYRGVFTDLLVNGANMTDCDIGIGNAPCTPSQCVCAFGSGTENGNSTSEECIENPCPENYWCTETEDCKYPKSPSVLSPRF